MRNQFTEKFVTRLAGSLFDGISSGRLKEGFTVADILHAALPLLDNGMLAGVALEQLIKDGMLTVHNDNNRIVYSLRYPAPKYRCASKEEKEVKPVYKTREMRGENPKTQQVGGTHYRDMAIQPIDYIVKNGIGFLEGNVIKYVSRWKSKGGTEDLKKAQHCIDLLLEQTGEAD